MVKIHNIFKRVGKWLLVSLVVLSPLPVLAITVTTTTDGNLLATTILGSGISISNVTYTGGLGQSGTFTQGDDPGAPADMLLGGIGMNGGIILTSGNATDAIGPNTLPNTSGFGTLAPDTDLDMLVSPFTTFDAAVLEFDFISAGGDLFFNFVFASEEYNEFVGSPFNDVFAFFLDGVNIGLIPGTTDPVTVNNINLGKNSEFYNNNNSDDGGPFFNIEYDGFTDVFTAQASGLGTGITHSMKIAIADTADFTLDSAVFIEAESFSDTMEGGTPMNPPTNPVPEPSTMLLLGTGLGTMVVWRLKRGGKN